MRCIGISRAIAGAVVLAVILLQVGCQTGRDPKRLLGMTVEESSRYLGDRGSIVYVRRGVDDPKTYSGYIVLSPYTIGQPANGSGLASKYWCRVNSGVIANCTGFHIKSPTPSLLKWFHGRQLSEVPEHFYVQSAGTKTHGWVPVEEYAKPLTRFSGRIFFSEANYVYYADFWQGECVEVSIGAR